MLSTINHLSGLNLDAHSSVDWSLPLLHVFGDRMDRKQFTDPFNIFSPKRLKKLSAVSSSSVLNRTPRNTSNVNVKKSVFAVLPSPKETFTFLLNQRSPLSFVCAVSPTLHLSHARSCNCCVCCKSTTVLLSN